uniref:CH-like domain-containing protein n=1 Tax=Eutreptiella gymnastica TaxID=73025 RepID=A0A7S1NJS1_9EUGL|mmetsp:Transcript_4655/g.8422  ORF Transcript_4655/g.8422 Transcript_4655/m.8422 type:complete len:821 (+) Transcript_4655:139-2601(+)
MAALPRELIKWLQGLDLSLTVKNAKRDFSNGYIVAEIFARYWPEISLHSFDTGSSLLAKADNWAQLEKYSKRRNLLLNRDDIDGVIHQKSGAAMAVISAIYRHLTGRELKQAAVEVDRPASTLPAFMQPTIGQLLREAHPEAHHVEQKIVRETKKVQRENESILERHTQAWKAAKLANPDRFKSKPKGNPMAEARAKNKQQKGELHEITVKSLNTSLILKSRLMADLSHSNLDEDARDKLAESAEVAHGLAALLSSICESNFTDLGVVFEDDTAPSTLSNGQPNFGSKFIMNLAKLPGDVRSVVWGALHNSVGEIVDLAYGSATEFGDFAKFFEPLFDEVSPTSEDWVAAEQLIVLVGKELVTRDPHVSLTLFLTFFLPRYRPLLLAYRLNILQYESFLRMFHAYTRSTNAGFRLAVFRSLQDFLCTSDAVSFSQMMRFADNPAIEPPSIGPLKLSTDITPFLLCMSFLAAAEEDTPEEVIDLYMYYATVGLGMTSPVARSASMAILQGMLRQGCGSQVVKQLPKLKRIAETSYGDWWETEASMLLLCADLLDQAPDDVALVMDVVMCCFHPTAPIPSRKIGLRCLARHVVSSGPGEASQHSAFLVHYMETLLSLPAAARLKMLSGDSDTPDTIQGQVRTYGISQVLTEWEPLAAAKGMCGYLARKPAHSSPDSATAAGLHSTSEVLALGILTKRFISDGNMREWERILDQLTPYLHQALQDYPNDETLQELTLNIMTKFYLELLTPEMPPEQDLEKIQSQAVEWFLDRVLAPPSAEPTTSPTAAASPEDAVVGQGEPSPEPEADTEPEAEPGAGDEAEG